MAASIETRSITGPATYNAMIRPAALSIASSSSHTATDACVHSPFANVHAGLRYSHDSSCLLTIQLTCVTIPQPLQLVTLTPAVPMIAGDLAIVRPIVQGVTAGGAG